jgi:hypothetical protein
MGTTFLDDCQRGQRSETASGLSSSLYFLQLVEPLPAFGVDAGPAHFAHATFIYGETLSISWALSTVASHLRRPRPFAYDPDFPDKTPDCSQLPESACRSFYSARASGAFAGAFSSAYLFSDLYRSKAGQGLSDRGANYDAATATAWGVQLGLATMVAGLQVKAGEAFYSDALVGALVGTSIGGGMYFAHSGSLRVTPSQAAGAGIGLLVGGAVAVFFPTGRSPFGSFLQLTPLDVPAIGAAVRGEL